MVRGLLRVVLFLSLLIPALPAAASDVPVTLRGSPASMLRQSAVAKEAGYPLVETPQHLRELVDDGVLVALPGNVDYRVNRGVSGPVARPELRLFVERLAAQYRAATGERLVVTSLTRPQSRQPRNAHPLSVHPAGIAVDLRISGQRAARAWLESTLLSLERQGVLDVTRERRPPHYHVALFPEAYLAHVEGMIGPDALAAALGVQVPVDEPAPPAAEVPAPVSEPAVPAPTTMATVAEPAGGRGGWLWLGAAAALVAGLMHRQRQRR